MMRTALAAVVAACLVAIVAAQIPARCASPREWEGKQQATAREPSGRVTAEEEKEKEKRSPSLRCLSLFLSLSPLPLWPLYTVILFLYNPADAVYRSVSPSAASERSFVSPLLFSCCFVSRSSLSILFCCLAAGECFIRGAALRVILLACMDSKSLWRSRRDFSLLFWWCPCLSPFSTATRVQPQSIVAPCNERRHVCVCMCVRVRACARVCVRVCARVSSGNPCKPQCEKALLALGFPLASSHCSHSPFPTPFPTPSAAGRALVRDSRRGQFVEVFSRYAYDETNMRKARYDDVEANRTTYVCADKAKRSVASRCSAAPGPLAPTARSTRRRWVCGSRSDRRLTPTFPLSLSTHSERYHVIELFREKKYYALNLRTRKCETGQLTERTSAAARRLCTAHARALLMHSLNPHRVLSPSFFAPRLPPPPRSLHPPLGTRIAMQGGAV